MRLAVLGPFRSRSRFERLLPDGACRHDRWEPFVDLIPDELSLARAQLGRRAAGLAEGVLRRQIARLEPAGGAASRSWMSRARSWPRRSGARAGRSPAARRLSPIRAGSLERRRPIVMLIEAEAVAAGGEPDRAARAGMERVIDSVGVDEAWRLRGGVPSRLAWPIPASMRPTQRRRTGPPGTAASQPPAPPSPERTAAAHARLEAARQAYRGRRATTRGTGSWRLALRLDPRVAAEGVSLLEPSLGPGAGRGPSATLRRPAASRRPRGPEASAAPTTGPRAA